MNIKQHSDIVQNDKAKTKSAYHGILPDRNVLLEIPDGTQKEGDSLFQYLECKLKNRSTDILQIYVKAIQILQIYFKN